MSFKWCVPFQSDRIKQFAGVNRRYDNRKRDVPEVGVEVVEKDQNPTPKTDKPIEDAEQRDPPGKLLLSHTTDNNPALNQLPWSGPGAAQSGPLLDYFNEVYHRNFSDMLGEVSIPR